MSADASCGGCVIGTCDSERYQFNRDNDNDTDYAAVLIRDPFTGERRTDNNTTGVDVDTVRADTVAICEVDARADARQALDAADGNTAVE